MGYLLLLLLVFVSFFYGVVSAACSNGGGKVSIAHELRSSPLTERQLHILDKCSHDDDCGTGLYCFSCSNGFSGSRCVRSSTTNQFKLIVRYLFLFNLCLIPQETAQHNKHIDYTMGEQDQTLPAHLI
ncbi:hypothetical protein Lal_00028034 [Lupinus albus]|nr:hypothetical protein Lal_00028034 [Lupinus albus]